MIVEVSSVQIVMMWSRNKMKRVENVKVDDCIDCVCQLDGWISVVAL